jgi:PAS domain S-box-containing protein
MESTYMGQFLSALKLTHPAQWLRLTASFAAKAISGWRELGQRLPGAAFSLRNFNHQITTPLRSLHDASSKLQQLVIFILVLGSLATAQTSVGPPRTLRVVVDNAYAPYSFQSDNGQLQGILIDQWQVWEKKTGIKAELHAMDWGEALRRMRAGEFDVIDSIAETDQRRDYFDFTPAYTTIEASIYFRKDISGISDLTSLKGFPVGVKTGDQHIDQLRANAVTTIIEFQNNDAIVAAAKEHKINVFVIDDPSALYLLNKAGIEEEFRHSAPIFTDGLRRAVRKGDAATLRLVADGFAAIDPGELKQIEEKWFGRTINRYGRYLTYAGYAVAIALLLIAGLAVWNRTLRKRILQRTALLFAKEQEFRAIVENAPDQIIRYDREFRRTYINPAVAKFYGLPAETLIDKPLGYGIPEAGVKIKEEELEQVRRAISTVFETGKPYDYELGWTTPKGRSYFSIRMFPELDLNGSVVNVLGISRDITESRNAEEELKKEKETLEKIFDNIPVMIGFVGDDGIKLVNPEWERTMGWTLKELQEQEVDVFEEAYPDPAYRREVLGFVTAATGEWVDLKIKVRSGRVIDVACAVVHLSDGTRVSIAQDITQRKQAEEKLKQSEQHLAEAEHLARVGSWNWDLQTNALDWSAELYRIFRLDEQSFIPSYEAVLELIHPEDRASVMHAVETSLKTGAPFSSYYRIVRLDKQKRVVHARGSIVTDEGGKPIRMLGTTQDVTERMQAEEQLQTTSEQLRALSARLQSAREEEGRRIAREIHDELGSMLTGLKWDLEEIGRTISNQLNPSELSALSEKLLASIKLTDISVDTLRRIASELRPSVLDDLGLAAAIEWQAQQFQARTGIFCSCDCSLYDLELNEKQATAVFRIFQEALTNILRHAQATLVEIKISKEHGQLTLSVSDNGKGIKVEKISGTESLGLLGMRERAHLVGGEMEVKGREGNGTVVVVRVPLFGPEKSLKMTR